MKLPFTRKLLIEWAGDQVVRDAEAIVARGMVIDAEYEAPFIRGTIRWNNRDLKTALKIVSRTLVESECPCYANIERGVICAHVIALGLSLVQRHTDPNRESLHQEEKRRAARLSAIKEDSYIRRVPPGTEGAIASSLQITVSSEWREQVPADRIALTCEASINGRWIPLDAIPQGLALSFTRQEESLLYILEDISEGPARGSLFASRLDFINILKLSAARSLPVGNGDTLLVNPAPIPSLVTVSMDPDSGRLMVSLRTELPETEDTDPPTYIVSGRDGWAAGKNNLWPLERMLPAPYHALYRAPIAIERTDVLRFLRQEIPLLAKILRVDSDISPDTFVVDPAQPTFALTICGSAASLSATLSVRYGETELVAGKRDAREHFAIPDPEDVLRYLVRNHDAETAALQTLRNYGFSGECGEALGSIVGRRSVLNFLGNGMPALRRAGWKIEMQGRVSSMVDSLPFATPVVRINDSGGGQGWFEVGFSIEANGNSLSPSEVQAALLRGDAYLERDGRTYLLDADAIESMQTVFADCVSQDGSASGTFRLSSVYAPFVKASLDALDGVDIEDNAAWRTWAGQANRTLQHDPLELKPEVENRLRPYQKEGITWLRFLEANGFCGLLADEMGLGKTIQALAWLQLKRCRPEAHGKPSLVVCPTSIVENWISEAATFAPELRTMAISGPDRHSVWERMNEFDLVITSYAVLRLDLEKFLQFEFATLVLDEAQHIKNRSTQNALSAKKLRAYQRLVLTGTPVENTVSDLWSIVDFLMPGYLGSHEWFREHYEGPISRGGPEAQISHKRLRRKLHPFMLRRLKREVAKDLPPKIEKVAPCSLTGDQTVVYNQLLESSRSRLRDLVAKHGVNRCRMEILSTLMRLRQVCCHLSLLKLPGLNPKFPSAKMDLFFELLNEALDGGHRVLVFSQFVTMLGILKAELDERSISYCYLDGATKERMQVVRTFNQRRDIPVFLVSLRAGGTGLNLTGADMVIHYDPWWNPAVESQATDRAYRIGQKRTVYDVRLITRGTVEEKVYELQQKKQGIIDATVSADERITPQLTWADVQEILSI